MKAAYNIVGQSKTTLYGWFGHLLEICQLLPWPNSNTVQPSEAFKILFGEYPVFQTIYSQGKPKPFKMQVLIWQYSKF